MIYIGLEKRMLFSFFNIFCRNKPALMELKTFAKKIVLSIPERKRLNRVIIVHCIVKLKKSNGHLKTM